MWNMKALSLIIQKLWPRLNLLWQMHILAVNKMDRLTDKWDLVSPPFPQNGGQEYALAVLEKKIYDGKNPLHIS